MIGAARSQDELVETFSEIPDGRFLSGDLLDEEFVERLAEEAGEVDILVNNAGGNPQAGPWQDQTRDDWTTTFELNVVAAARLAAHLTPGMQRREFGRIINVSSIYGFLGRDERAGTGNRGGAYTVAKHGVVGLTRFLATRLGAYGITVNTVSPGMVFWRGARSELEQTVIEHNAGRTPLGRNGTVEEIVGPVVFLASDEASFVTGHNLVVDGGWSCW